MPEENSEPKPTSRDGDARTAALAYVLPLAIYMVLGTLEPDPHQSVGAGGDLAGDEIGADSLLGEVADMESVETAEGGESDSWWPLPGRYYPVLYAIKIALTVACVGFFLPVYRRAFPLKVSPLSFVVGVVGVVVWIALYYLGAEAKLVELLGGPNADAVAWLGLGERPAFNPLEEGSGWPFGTWGFLAIRFAGLVLLVPIIEELFVRAFLMRYVMHDNWTEIPFGEVNRLAVVAGIALPVLYHPEKLSALVWFGMVTWLMVRTRNFWDCVVAHAVTNLLLGIYVVVFKQWALW